MWLLVTENAQEALGGTITYEYDKPGTIPSKLAKESIVASTTTMVFNLDEYDKAGTVPSNDDHEH